MTRPSSKTWLKERNISHVSLYSDCLFQFSCGCVCFFVFCISFRFPCANRMLDLFSYYSPVLHLKISPFGFRVKTHIAFMMNFWKEYICIFFCDYCSLFFQFSTAWITVLRSDKQALCEVQVFFFLYIFWYFFFRLWFVKNGRPSVRKKRKAYIITNNAHDFDGTKFTIFFPRVFYLSCRIVHSANLKIKFASLACSSLYIYVSIHEKLYPDID